MLLEMLADEFEDPSAARVMDVNRDKYDTHGPTADDSTVC